MKAIAFTRYGAPDVLELVEVEKPKVQDNEVLIKIHASTVTSGDARIRNGTRKSLPLWPISKIAIGFTKPRKTRLGWDLAGEVVSVGKDVQRFQEGDHVYGMSGNGTNAQYISMPEEGSITLKPDNMTYEEAASVPFGALSALFFLRKGKIKTGQKVLVYGASGSLGTFAVQLANYFGAEVTGVCSTSNLQLVKSLGADHVIDYTKEDFTKNEEAYDIIFDTVGKTSFSRCKHVLQPNGHYVLAVFDFPEIVQMLWTSVIGKQKVYCGISEEKQEDLLLLKDLIEKGEIKSVIDKHYSYEQIAEAHEYVDKGHKKGSVVVTWSHEED